MIRTFLRILLDTFFPPSEHGKWLRRITPVDFLTHYNPTSIDGVIALAPYQSRSVQAAVAAGKFENNHHAAQLLAPLFTRWLTLHPTSGLTVLIPVPLSTKRENERQFNQVTRVLSYLPPSEHYQIQTNWLVRSIDTNRQTSLDRAKRLKNMTGAFTATSSLQHASWRGVSRIILCDDVITTGATLKAAHTVLRKHIPKNVEVLCIAWAH